MGIGTLFFGPIFGNISPVRLLFRQTYLCKTTRNKAKKSCVNCKHFRKQWISRSDLYLFIHFFLPIIFNANAHFASIIHHQHRFYTYKERKKKADITDCHYDLITIVLLMSDHQFLFWFFTFSSSLEDVENSWRSGVGVGLRGSVGLYSKYALRKRLRICSVISVNYHYITVLCLFNLLIRFKCYNTV